MASILKAVRGNTCVPFAGLVLQRRHLSARRIWFLTGLGPFLRRRLSPRADV